MFSMLQIVFGSIGSKVLKKTLCPVLVVFLCCGWLSSIYMCILCGVCSYSGHVLNIYHTINTSINFTAYFVVLICLAS